MPDTCRGSARARMFNCMICIPENPAEKWQHFVRNISKEFLWVVRVVELSTSLLAFIMSGVFRIFCSLFILILVSALIQSPKSNATTTTLCGLKAPGHQYSTRHHQKYLVLCRFSSQLEATKNIQNIKNLVNEQQKNDGRSPLGDIFPLADRGAQSLALLRWLRESKLPAGKVMHAMGPMIPIHFRYILIHFRFINQLNSRSGRRRAYCYHWQFLFANSKVDAKPWKTSIIYGTNKMVHVRSI